MPKLKIEEAGSFSKCQRQKLQNLFTQGAAACGSVLNLAKASRIPVSNVRQFLHSKASHTKFTSATQKFKRMRAFARFRNEIWSKGFAYVDKLTEDNKGVNHLLVCHDLFDRILHAKGIKTNNSHETLKAFSSVITKRNQPAKIWVVKVTEIAGTFEKYCAAEGIRVYSVMSETTAAFAERSIRSLENVFYHYMEDYGYNYIHRLPQSITTLNSRRNGSIDMRPKNVKNCDFMSLHTSKSLQYKEPTFQLGDRVRISKYDLPFCKSYKPQFTREFFQIVANATRETATYAIKPEQDEVI